MQKTSPEPKRILVPVPLKGNFEAPLKQAFFFQSKYGSQITVLNVVHEVPFLERWLSPLRLKKHRKKAMKKLRHSVQECFGRSSRHPNMHYEAVTGEIVPSILKVAKNRRSDLIIIKKARRIQGRRRFFKQENIDRLLTGSKCPVMILGETVTDDVNRIMLPFDITEKTEHKAAWAKSLAKHFGAEIHVVSVMNIDRSQSYLYQKGFRIVNDMKKEGINAELVILKKGDRSVEEAVLNYAREYRPDFIIMMARRENTFFESYPGSITREIIHRSGIPVFNVVPIGKPGLRNYWTDDKDVTRSRGLSRTEP